MKLFSAADSPLCKAPPFWLNYNNSIATIIWFPEPKRLVSLDSCLPCPDIPSNRHPRKMFVNHLMFFNWLVTLSQLARKGIYSPLRSCPPPLFCPKITPVCKQTTVSNSCRDVLFSFLVPNKVQHCYGVTCLPFSMTFQ